MVSIKKNTELITLIFLEILMLLVLSSCRGRGESEQIRELTKKEKLFLEVKVFVDYLNFVEGQKDNRVIVMTKFIENGLNCYHLENLGGFYIKISPEELQDEKNKLFLGSNKDLSLNAFKIFGNNLVCLYNNVDLPDLEYDLTKIPKKYKHKTFMEMMNDSVDYEKNYLFFETLRETQTNNFCLNDAPDIKKDSSFIKFRNKKMKPLLSMVCN